jgi:phosphate transport system substrate-binding protein
MCSYAAFDSSVEVYMRNHGRKILNRVLSGGLAISMAGFLAACSGGSTASMPSAVLPGTHNASSHGVSPDAVLPVYGGGSTFISLVARSWMDCYGVAIAPGTCSQATVNPNTQLLYAAIGSGNALTAFLTQTPATSTPSNPPPFTSPLFPNYPYPEWDYSGSDAPLSTTQISQYASSDQAQRGNPVEIPITSDGVAVPYNPSGLTLPTNGLHLSVNTLCGIFGGGITNWNDSHITADNNGVQVSSNLPMLVVFRSDGSGTTFLTQNHLNTACASTSFPWPGGAATTTWTGPTGTGFIGESGSQGVAGEVAATAGAIGYVSPSFLGPPNNIPSALLQDNYALNHPTANQYIAVNTAHIIAALAGVTLPANPTPTDILNDTIVPDSTRKGAWPIAGFSYLDLYQCYATKAVKNHATGFVQWVTSSKLPLGQSLADQIVVAGGLVYLPTRLKQVTFGAMNQIEVGPVSGLCTI